ncbi:MAG: hypothetical protein M1833_000214 [Piccolia ochrophora]|nr:MAG: hypothetical protein M1833_000214 [Piccolia ochrophora]
MPADLEGAAADGLSKLVIESEDVSSPTVQPSPRQWDPPRVRKGGLKTRDVTGEFVQASQALDTGHLVKDDWFTLFESVGALEIMDPKMDSGYLAPGEILEDSYDVMRPLLPEEVIGVIDGLLCHEMAWHMGSPLSQTLFTSVYIDRLLWPEPRSLNDARFSRLVLVGSDDAALNKILRSYCLALIKCCDFVHHRVSSEHCYEEEDFVTQTYNRSLLSGFSEAAIMTEVAEALQCLDVSADEMRKDVQAALEARLRFRMSFLRALAMDVQVIENRSTLVWDDCGEYLDAMIGSHSLGKPVPESFSVKIQRRLASTVPPRPILNVRFEDATAHLRRTCQDGKDVVRVLEYDGSNSTLTFAWMFQSRKPQPSVYIRSLLQALLFNDMNVLGRMSVKQLLFDDLAEMVLPDDVIIDPDNSLVEAPQDPRFQIAQRMEAFIARAGQSYLDVFRVVCQNRSRIRRTFCHTIHDWDNLQLEAEELDTELRQYTKEVPIFDPSVSPEPIFAFPLSSWAYSHKLRQMEWIIQLGFELDVYQVDELGGMYWYLHHLTETRLAHLERMRGFVTRKIRSLPSTLPNQQSQAFARTLSFLNLSLLEANATNAFAEGLFCLYTILSRSALLPEPSRPYSSDALRYELRVKPFLAISIPALVPFEEYRAMSANSSESMLLL